jgi:protocatechuate 3,4-dioxygenase beta subunit
MIPTLIAAFLTLAAAQDPQVRPAAPVVPPRDAPASAVPKGTGVIRGRVIAADGERPIERVRLMLLGTAAAGSMPPTVTSDSDGRYAFTDLPPGRYLVRATRSGYLASSYGQRRPLEAGRPLALAEGEKLDGIDFELSRMGVISGRIVDELGEPMAGVSLAAMRHEYFEGQRQLIRMSYSTQTDDTGAYRITGLAPGEYAVMAQASETWVDATTRAVLAYAQTYFPGTANASEAQRVKLAVGQEARTIDFAMFPSRAATISGTAVDSRGQPAPPGVEVDLTTVFRSPLGYGYAPGGTAKVGADGVFTIRHVVPAEYHLLMRLPAAGGVPAESVQLPLVMTGSDITDLRLATAPPGKLAGRIVADAGVRRPLVRAQLRVVAAPVDRAPTAVLGSPQGAVREDYTFELTDLRGLQRVTMFVPDGWALKAILVGSRDYVDTPIDFSRGEHFISAVLVLTDKVTRLTGRVLDAKDEAAADATVIAFAAEAEKWGIGSRHVKTTRPDKDGKYEIEGLPPGAYLVVALDEHVDGHQHDPDYLNGLREGAAAVTLGDAEARQFDVRKLALPRERQ